MRIATWNINGLRARLDFVLAWLKDREPDVVGLQELKMTDEKFPHAAFEALGYQGISHGQKAWNGVAVLSRNPGEVIQKGLLGQEDFGSRLLSVRVDGIVFTTLYCPNGKTLEHEDYLHKLAWFDDLAEYLGAQSAKDTTQVLCGDFNVCPTALDSFDGTSSAGEIFHTDAERARIQSLYDLDLLDLFRQKHPDEQVFSWWDYRGGSFHRGHGLRIDFLLGNASIRQRLVSAQVDRDWRKKKDGMTPSDHAPVFIDID